MTRAGYIGTAVGIVLAAAGGLALYQQPEFMVQLSNVIWGCF